MHPSASLSRQPVRHLGPLRLVVVAAMLIFLFWQPLDAAGHVASEARENGSTSLLMRAISAFDVLDDSLDNSPDRDHPPAVHQLVLHALPCCAAIEVGQHIVEPFLAQVFSSNFFLPNNLLSQLFRPPD